MILVLPLASMAITSPLAPGTEVRSTKPLGSHIAVAEKDEIRFNTYTNGFSIELIGGEPVEAFTCCDLQVNFELSQRPTYFYAQGFGELRAPFVIFKDGKTTRFDLNGISLNADLEALSVGARQPGLFDYVGAASPTWLKSLTSVQPASAREKSVLLISVGEYEGEKQQRALDTFKQQAKRHFSKVIEKTFLGGHGFAAWGSAFEALLFLMNDTA